MKLLSAEIIPEVAEKPLPYDETLLSMLSADAVKRLKSAHATFKYCHHFLAFCVFKVNKIQYFKIEILCFYHLNGDYFYYLYY